MNVFSFFFFFNDTATTEIYTLSLHDALPISRSPMRRFISKAGISVQFMPRSTSRAKYGLQCHCLIHQHRDRKSTRLNSSHLVISYAVFCLKKKKKTQRNRTLLPY